MTPYNDIDLVQIGSGNEWLVAWRRQGAKPLPEQVEGPVIWSVMTAMLHHCKNKATKRDFGITND